MRKVRHSELCRRSCNLTSEKKYGNFTKQGRRRLVMNLVFCLVNRLERARLVVTDTFTGIAVSEMAPIILADHAAYIPRIMCRAEKVRRCCSGLRRAVSAHLCKRSIEAATSRIALPVRSVDMTATLLFCMTTGIWKFVVAMPMINDNRLKWPHVDQGH